MNDDVLDPAVLDAHRREAERIAYPADLPAIPPLPAARYFDPHFHELEIQHVFKKTWLGVGHVSELPEPGSYKLFERIGQSIIVSRGTDEVIRAFRNACRHRGAALLTEPSGMARRFVCPYHAWSFATDGTLKAVPNAQNFACLDKTELPLSSVLCEIWRGFIFINLAANAEPLAEFMAPLTAEVADFPFESMVVKGVVVNELECNWKTAYDNFLESYHINTVHRKTIAPFMDTATFMVKRLPHGHGCFQSLKKGSESIFATTGIADIGARFKAQSIAIPRFPNATTGLDSAGFNWQTFWPVGPEKMAIVNIYLGVTLDDPEADRKYWDNFITYNDTILAEDMELFPTIQRAMREGDIAGLMLGTQELYIQWYHEHLDRAIGPENVPPALRVEPVLSQLERS